MSQEACPLPTDPSAAEEQVIARLLKARRVAVVGISTDTDRAGYYVPEYLQAHGYEIVPVNPKYTQWLGKPVLRTLGEVKPAPELVLVFRRSDHCADVAGEAIAAGARGIWLQAGIINEEAHRLAKQAGIDFVQDRCMMVEHSRRG